MKSLSTYQNAINDTIAVGKSIGDAFVWFFYQKNRNYLVEHLSQDEVFHAPPGTGGFGEQELIKKFPVLNGYFVLHHGVTSILRLGDISLVDIDSFTVSGIGEIKTSGVRKDGTVQVNLLFSGPNINKKRVEKPIAEMAESEPSFEDALPEKSKQRLKRQLERISKSYKTLTETPRQKIAITQDNCLDNFEQAFNEAKVGKFLFKKISNGLIIGIYKDHRKSFSSKMVNHSTADFSQKMDDIEKSIRNIMKEGREDNSIQVGYFHYNKDGKSSLLPGMTHPVWWPINNSILKDIIFQNSIIVTLYNPAHLISEFEKHGYSLKYKEQKIQSIYQQIGDKEISITGFNYYLNMITQYLFSEESIVKIIEETKNLTQEEKTAKPFQIGLNIQQHL
ncbi:hypothetical protein [Methylophaga pinxianii]|nr:hypothetical protein [Methylophaga pinxianii]UPH44694.1 hypothetical protein LGT42_009230 [Methylophaga pinxianii]